MVINYNKLNDNINNLKEQWNDSSKPFRYLVYDGLLDDNKADEILEKYPLPEISTWDNKTYINQKNKFTKTNFEDSEIFKEVFNEFNSKEFLNYISKITGIENLKGDPDFFGGGLHTSTNGAFLDVHVDFNIHPKTKYHRRMNIILYMNKDWKIEYNGYLELWDMNKNIQIEYIAPIFNRCVIFETNEVSFHGHPKKLNTPEGISRKSLALYYYTDDRPEVEIASEHNTIYVNTEGFKGKVKNLFSGLKAFIERI